MNFGDWLLKADREVFYLINKKLSFVELDNVMLLLRQAFTWIPLYLFFLLFFVLNCRRYLIPIVILSLLTFALSDFTSASIFKPFIGRLRPCHDTGLPFQINNIAGCGGIYSMPSSHSTNHFGLATFWYLILKETLGIKWKWLFVWAALVCYAQVYVGVHYPADILVGAVLGSSIAYFCYYLFCKWVKIEPLESKTTVRI